MTIRDDGPTTRSAPVIRAAFGGTTATCRVPVGRGGPRTLDLAGLVDERDGRVVGHVGLSRAWLDARRELVDIWMLSPLSVLPDLQRHGDRHRPARRRGRDRPGRRRADAGARGSPAYYGSRGFDRAGRHGIRPASARTPEAACQVVLFDAHEEWMTGQVVYRDVWWRHDAAGLRDPLLADLERRFAELDE